MTVTVADVVAVLDTAYPPGLAESWDRVGLVCGDESDEITRVAFALDPTDAVVDAALAAGAQMLVCHHPLLLRGVSSVAANTPKGRIVHRLIRGGCALFTAHTNADRARPGTNDHLAELLGIRPGRPIVPATPTPLDRWVFTVPEADAERVKDAVFAVGAGTVDDYAECSFEVTGMGQFRPLAGADPAIGVVGDLEHVRESRVEFLAPRALRGAVHAALTEAHPYEVPAFDILEDHVTGFDLDSAVGLGRIGELDAPMTLREFTARVEERLPRTVWGVRAAGDPERMVRTVAICTGSGDSLLDDVARLGVDVYLTSDLRHHPADEHLRAGGPALVDTAHWASEFPWCRQAEAVVRDALGVDTVVVEVRTDPWTLGGTVERPNDTRSSR